MSSDPPSIRDQPGYDIIIPAGLVSYIPNGLSLIYLITRILNRWWTYSVVNGHTLQGQECKVVGGMTFFFVVANVTLVGSLSLTTYLRICRKRIINFGTYDYKLFSGVILVAVTFTLINIYDFGPNRFWCYSAPTDQKTPLITISLIFFILIVTTYCYLMTLLEVNIQQKNIRRLGTESAKLSRVDLIVVRKIIGYILTFIIEWIPSVIYFISQMAMYDNIWIYTVAVVAINFGGIGNMILYIVHESWTNQYDSSEYANSIPNISESSTSGIYILSSNNSKNNQELRPQITVHNTITIEKEILTSSSPTSDSSNQEHH
ncbi:6803_t:CDS:2 [Cetraspora pellucida]|uniref:6803_t:CDS:1 n=1 Tax=Cetraspora pellucida TaxID=1433469 RepID=A0ACA9KX30_9GLOM|nr:6803_t:CDS:2 [Cetraspora pellucida]